MWWATEYHWRWLAERRARKLNEQARDETYEWRTINHKGRFLRVEAFWRQEQAKAEWN